MTFFPFRTVITDTNILINLVLTSRLGLCGGLPGVTFVLPEMVLGEVIKPDQRSAVEAAIHRGGLLLDLMTDLLELVIFAELTDRMGRGEAACLAVASNRGWSLASDEKGRFRKEAVARLGEERLLGTADILFLGIRAGLLTVEQADEDKALLEKCRFKMPFTSFRDLFGMA